MWGIITHLLFVVGSLLPPLLFINYHVITFGTNGVSFLSLKIEQFFFVNFHMVFLQFPWSSAPLIDEMTNLELFLASDAEKPGMLHLGNRFTHLTFNCLSQKFQFLNQFQHNKNTITSSSQSHCIFI